MKPIPIPFADTPGHVRGTRASLAWLPIAALAAGCASEPPSSPGPQPIGEDVDVVVPESERGAASTVATQQFWGEGSHVSMSGLAAEKWGLPTSRVSVVADGGDDPDVYEAGYSARYNQQWSHAYLNSSTGLWIWGDAHENFYDCLTGDLAGSLEGPECKDGGSARAYYLAGDQREGDRFLGRALHYIEDVSQVLHASDPTLDMLTRHIAFEAWVTSNWTSGHCFRDTVRLDNYYYPISDARQAVRNAAWAASYYNSAGYGRAAWQAYRASGYPTAAGTGSAELVLATRQMLLRASRYATGAIKLALDSYGEWDSRY